MSRSKRLVRHCSLPESSKFGSPPAEPGVYLNELPTVRHVFGHEPVHAQAIAVARAMREISVTADQSRPPPARACAARNSSRTTVAYHNEVFVIFDSALGPTPLPSAIDPGCHSCRIHWAPKGENKI